MRKIVLTICLLLCLMPHFAFAQSAKQSLEVEGLSISPFIIEVNANPGETITKSITLGNTTKEPLSFVASINDFTPNGTTGQPIFLGTNKNADPKFSLSSWITITKQPQFTIAPLSQTTVEFTITIPTDVEPGTHYGGILFGRPSGGIDASGSVVQQKAGAIILVKLGKSEEEIDVEKYQSDKRLFWSLPVNFSVLLDNFGNVHSKPKGEITIKNIASGQILQVPVNRDANIILPDSKREFTSTWQPKFAFGRYTGELVMYYGNPKLEIRKKIAFWVFPLEQIGIGVIILLILGIILYIAIRSYNRFIIKRSRHEN